MSVRSPPKPDRTTTDQDPLLERIYEGEAPDTVDTNVRWAAYANRLRTVMRSAHRYVAYTSDIGESFRPVAHPRLVRTAYVISWGYLIGDMANEGYKAYVANQARLHGHKITPVPGFLAGEDEGKVQKVDQIPFLEDWRTVMAQRAVFQSLASMGLPALTIHSVVKYSGKAMKNVKNPKLRTWGPIGLGLSIVPALPYIFDHPVEVAVEWAFEKGYEVATGKKGTVKEKDL